MFWNTEIPSDTQLLNAGNRSGSRLPRASDVVVVGAGIHSLIYAIHAKKISVDRVDPDTNKPKSLSITVLEKTSSPSYKIGESTLTVFGLWLKTIGIDSHLLWRLFGPKDGLAFYYLAQNGDPEDYTSFTANGPPGDFVPTLQIERKVSELLLTLIAQRMGVTVLHGHVVDTDRSDIGLADEKSILKVKEVERGTESSVTSRLMVDATGRFRRIASKNTRLKRFKGWNTHAFWAYFECPGDEADIPLAHYESCNTNHICLAEGWAWIIRLPSWEGSPMPNMIAMINHLLDLNEHNTPGDQYPSSLELAQKFDLQFKWVVSIGFALRTDVIYPNDITSFGSCEAEQKFNWIVKQYPKMDALMKHHVLIKDLYGPGTTWFIRKNLTYQSPRVTGQGWLAIGDAVGFTNPLYSPGINANMGTSIYAAELTRSYMKATDLITRMKTLAHYEVYCRDRSPNLHRMNVFNYLCMRSPQTGLLGPLWQYLTGTGNSHWQKLRSYTFDDVSEVLTGWDWGSNQEEYIDFAEEAIAKLAGPPSDLDPRIIEEVCALSARRVREALASHKFMNKWGNLLRWYDNDLQFNEMKDYKEIMARRCDACTNWRILRSDTCRCPTCGAQCGI